MDGAISTRSPQLVAAEDNRIQEPAVKSAFGRKGMSIKVGINGFGRIGRMVLRAASARFSGHRDRRHQRPARPTTIAHMLDYDTVHGQVSGHARGRRRIARRQRQKIASRWRNGPGGAAVGVSSASTSCVECTGLFTDQGERRRRTLRPARKSHHVGAVGKDVDADVRLRCQSRHAHRPRTRSFPTRRARPTALRRSPRRCTTTGGIKRGLMTTIHAYTDDADDRSTAEQGLAARARGIAQNIIPTIDRRRRRPSAWSCPSSTAGSTASRSACRRSTCRSSILRSSPRATRRPTRRICAS